MIGQLRGKLLAKRPPQLLIDVQGVGYEVDAPMSTFYVLGEVGSDLQLLTHLVVREDAHLLFGFATEAERRLFRALIKVSGVGAKIALAILSGISAADFSRCVQSGDIASLTRVPGIGKKTAERLIIEMRDKLSESLGGHSFENTHVLGDMPMAEESAAEQAIAALVALGYKAPEAARMISQLPSSVTGTEDLIRHALKATVRVG